MQRADKERAVEELTQRLAETDSLIVADYRGLTNAQLAGVRSKLREHGATLSVVKNTLTRRACEAAGAESLLALLEGPTAIAFVQADGDPVAVAKALADTAKDTKILSLRGGLLSGKAMAAADVEELAKLPPEDVLKSQLVGVIVAPLTQLLGLLEAPVRDLVGLIDARIAQLGEPDEEPAPVETAATDASAETTTDAPPDVEAAAEGPGDTASDEIAEDRGETEETQEEAQEETQEEQE